MNTNRTLKMLAAVRGRINEPSEQGLTNAQLLIFLNDAQMELCIELNDGALAALKTSQTVALTLDEAAYALPTTFMREQVLKYKTILARRWSVRELDALSGTNVLHEPTEGRPYYFLWNNQLWIRAGTKTAGNYIFYYLAEPTDMTVVLDPSLPVEYDDMMTTFAVSLCREAQGQLAEAERMRQEFLGRCRVVNSRFGGAAPYDNVPGDRRVL